MSVTPRTINENEAGVALEFALSAAKADKTKIAEKLTKPAQREPLTERLLGAEKRRNSHLSEKKEKAQVKIEEVIKRRDEQIETSTQKISSEHQERIKSAETKRKSIIEEKTIKARQEVEKAKQIAAEAANPEGLKKCIDEKLVKAQQKRDEAIKEKLEKCKVNKKEPKDESEAKMVALEKKLSAAQLNRDAKIEQEKTRLKEKHEKVKEIAAQKKKTAENQ